MPDTLSFRRSLPPGVALAMRPAADGWPLRTMLWPGAAGGPGSILFLNGRGDFIEKYAESYWQWRAQGYGVTVFDWRGQGGSGRVGDDAMKGDCLGFEPWLADLDGVIDWFMATQPRPWFVVAHSMGGHLLLRHLANNAREFSRAVLLSPMLGLVGAPFGPRLVALWANLAVLRGKGGDYAPTQNILPALRYSPARMLVLTHDAARYADEHWWVQQCPELMIGGVTNRWLASAFASLARLQSPGALEAIATPTLVLAAAQERLVDNRVTAAIEARMPDAAFAMVPGAAHELLRECDAVRDVVLARIAAFLAA